MELKVDGIGVELASTKVIMFTYVSGLEDGCVMTSPAVMKDTGLSEAAVKVAQRKLPDNHIKIDGKRVWGNVATIQYIKDYGVQL